MSMSAPLRKLPLAASRIAPSIDRGALAKARLRVVPRRRTAAPRVPFVATVSLILVGGVVGLLLFNTSMQQASFAATALQEQADTLTARQQTLTMELDALRNPQRVAEAAQRMGMVPATTPAFLDLETGKITGEPTVATREDGLRITARPPRKPAVLNPKAIVVREVADTATTTPGSADGGRHDGRAGKKKNR